jgi:predicted GH43/DUF377 family glycosyl hydrolase
VRWRKRGLVFRPDGQRPWMRSHAAVPLPLALGDGRWRVYFGTRDETNRPRVGFVEFDLAQPEKILRVSEACALGPGPAGAFDDNGVYPGSVVADGASLRMYFAGRHNHDDGTFAMEVGLAVSDDGGVTFTRVEPCPLLARGEHDPCMVSTPCVRREDGLWRLWYLSGLRWERADDAWRSFYHLKYAESDDGIAWRRDGHVAIELGPNETNIASPTVLRDPDGYRMWYSYVAGAGYRIGYAESGDGITWTRRDDAAGIDVSPSGWDAEMIGYPHVFRHGEELYMLYSGNGFGRDGFGLAVAER